MNDLTGQTIKGYELKEQIGIGGFGAVYRAYQATVDREVAIKVILPKYASHPNFNQRFDAEAKIVAKLEHPHIVPLFDYWRDDAGAYLVMQWMGGGNVHRSLETEGAWPLERITKLLDQITAALSAAHKRNVVHRDIKPANILLDVDGNAYLADFGIAKDLQSDANLTQEHSILGSPAYLSPEQIRGEKVTPQTDIYSLGIVLYELLTSKHPFEGASTKTMIAKHRKETLPSLQLSSSNLPAALDAIVQRATAKERTHRYTDTESLAKAFHHALRSMGPTIINPDRKADDITNSIPIRQTIPDDTLVPVLTGDLQARLYEKAATILEKPRRLIGRDNIVEQVQQFLAEKESVLLHGFGGMGKTALAASVASEFIQQGNGSVLWLEIGSKSTDMIFEALAKALDKQQDIAEKSGDERILAMREILSDYTGLLVLDNVWNEHALFQTMRSIPALTPVLITSRYAMPIDGEVIDIEALPSNDALALLSYHARKKYEDDDEAQKLCEKLGNHPFALEIVGKRLKVLRHLTPATLMKDIADAPHTLEIPGEFSEVGRRGIKDLFDSSVNELKRTQREVFASLGALSSSMATIQLLSLVLKREQDKVEESLADLERRGLVELVLTNDTPNHYRIHDLTYSYAHAMFQIENQGYKSVFDAVKQFTSEHSEDFDLLDFEQGNILGIASIAQIKQADAVLVEVLKVLSLDGYLNARGHTPLFLECLDGAIEVARKSKDTDKEVLHHLLSKRGNAFKDRGDLDSAIRIYQEALGLAPNTNREAILLSVVGMTIYQNGGSGVESYFERAYKVAKDNNDDMALSFVLDYRGVHALFEEQFQPAREFLTEAVEVAERLGDTTRLFFSLQNLGWAQEALKQVDTALETHQRALKIAEDESNHRWKSLALHSIAEDYHAKNDREKAQEHYDRALKLYQKLGVTAKADEIMQFLEKENYIIPTE